MRYALTKGKSGALAHDALSIEEDEAMTTTASTTAVSSRTLVRGLSLLEIVAAQRGGIGVTEVAEAAELDKGTASRLLATLRDLGYVQQRGTDRRYVLGSRCLWLAHEYQASQEELTARAKPHLAALRDASGETVHLAIREGLHVVYVAQEEPDRSIRVRSAVGSKVPLYRTAMGRAILATMQDVEQLALLDQIRAEVDAAGDDVDFDDFRHDISEARTRGWAAVDHHDDVTRIAAAIVDAGGEPIAAITLSGPSYRLADQVEIIAPSVVRVAKEVSESFAG